MGDSRRPSCLDKNPEFAYDESRVSGNWLIVRGDLP
jgi:hypothetical protein